MHITPSRRRDANIVSAWAVAVADTVRAATEGSTGMAGGAPAALVAIVAEPGLSIDQLRHVLGLTHGGAVRLVDRLVERGWVTREPAPGRAVALVATADGRHAERRLAAAREEAVLALLGELDDEQSSRLAQLVSPVLGAATGDGAALRRLCRLCDRAGCDPCPVWDAVPRGVPR